MISDFDEEICILEYIGVYVYVYEICICLGDELWGCRVAMAQFLRGVERLSIW